MNANDIPAVQVMRLYKRVICEADDLTPGEAKRADSPEQYEEARRVASWLRARAEERAGRGGVVSSTALCMAAAMVAAWFRPPVPWTTLPGRGMPGFEVVSLPAAKQRWFRELARAVGASVEKWAGISKEKVFFSVRVADMPMLELECVRRRERQVIGKARAEIG